MNVYVYIYIYIYTYVYMYIYIYNTHVYVYIYIYMYTPRSLHPGESGQLANRDSANWLSNSNEFTV